MPDRARRPKEPTSPEARFIESTAARILADMASLTRAIAAEAGLPRDFPAPEIAVSIPVEVHLGRQAETETRSFLVEARRRVLAAVQGAGTFRYGHVYCFQCERPDCGHSRPSDPEEVFCGYTTGGRPVFKAFTNYLLERNDPRVEGLYATPPKVTALVVTEKEISQEYSSEFSRDDIVWRVRGQVVCGLLPACGSADARCALTIQVVETHGPGPVRRLRLNVIGVRTDDLPVTGRDLKAIFAMRRMFQAAQARLDALGRRARDAERRGFPDGLDEAVGPVLAHLRSDLERLFRSAARRTLHAEERHSSRVRPTSQALRDALEAPIERVLFDTRRETIVVLGPRQRAHVFTRDGRLVTSLVLSPSEVERRYARARWRPLERDEVERWRERLASQG